MQLYILLILWEFHTRYHIHTYALLPTPPPGPAPTSTSSSPFVEVTHRAQLTLSFVQGLGPKRG